LPSDLSRRGCLRRSSDPIASDDLRALKISLRASSRCFGDIILIQLHPVTTNHPSTPARCPLGLSYSPLSYAPRTLKRIPTGIPPSLSQTCRARNVCAAWPSLAPPSALPRSSPRAQNVPAAFCARLQPSDLSHTPLSPRGVRTRRCSHSTCQGDGRFHVGTNSKIETDSLRPPTSRASSA
jgi:hypothetical protein